MSRRSAAAKSPCAEAPFAILNRIMRHSDVKSGWFRLGLLIPSMSICVSVSTPAQQTASYLPNPKLTPGDTVKVSKSDLCGPDKNIQDGAISITVKSKVFNLYGIRTDRAIPHNIDHLVPMSLGGTNSLKNLWPQPLAGEWTYHQKNRLERKLHKLVCRGELDVEKAQQEISNDWVSAYKKYLAAPAGKQANRD